MKRQVRGRNTHFLPVLLRGRGNIQGRMFQSVKGIIMGLKYYKIFWKKLSLKMKWIKRERSRNKKKEKMSHVIVIVM